MADKKPAAPTIPDADIKAQADAGMAMFKTQREGAPRVFNPVAPVGQGGWKDALITGLLGLQAGTAAAAQSAKYGDSTVGALAGLGAGAAVPGMVDKMRMEQMEAMPVEQFSPDLVKTYPELQGVPMGMVNKISSMISARHRSEAGLRLAALKEQMRDDNAIIDQREANEIATSFNDPALAQRLVGLRRSAAANILPKIGFDSTTGQVTMLAPKAFNAAVPGQADFSKQLKQSLDSVSTISRISGQYLDLARAGKTGLVGGNVEKFKGFISNGKFAPEATNYEKFRSGFLASLKAMTGENGVLSDQDSTRIAELLPPIGEDAEFAARRFAEIFELLDERIENYKVAYPQFANRIASIQQRVEQIKSPDGTATRTIPAPGATPAPAPVIKVKMIAPNGEQFEIPEKNVDAAIRRGARRA